MEISRLRNKDIRVVVKRMIKELMRRMHSQSEKLEILNKLENMKNSQTKMKNTITEMIKKNTKKVIKSRLNHIEKWISELENRVVEIGGDKPK